MKAAIQEAMKARALGDYAIGAVVVKNCKIIAQSPNHSKIDEDPSSHAEMLAIRYAAKKLGSRHLSGCILYTTHEPCPMCAGASVMAMLEGVVFGASRKDMGDYRSKNGNDKFLWRNSNIPATLVLSEGVPKIEVIEGFMREECKDLFHS